MHYSILSFVEPTSLCLSLTHRRCERSDVFLHIPRVYLCLCCRLFVRLTRAACLCARVDDLYAEENVRNCVFSFTNAGDALAHLACSDEAQGVNT